jgi:hypothetical protein
VGEVAGARDEDALKRPNARRLEALGVDDDVAAALLLASEVEHRRGHVSGGRAVLGDVARTLGIRRSSP